jgi:hypothetical protein
MSPKPEQAPNKTRTKPEQETEQNFAVVGDNTNNGIDWKCLYKQAFKMFFYAVLIIASRRITALSRLEGLVICCHWFIVFLILKDTALLNPCTY